MNIVTCNKFIVLSVKLYGNGDHEVEDDYILFGKIEMIFTTNDIYHK